MWMDSMLKHLVDLLNSDSSETLWIDVLKNETFERFNLKAYSLINNTSKTLNLWIDVQYFNKKTL